MNKYEIEVWFKEGGCYVVPVIARDEAVACAHARSMVSQVEPFRHIKKVLVRRRPQNDAL
jgi:hypothetical protein